MNMAQRNVWIKQCMRRAAVRAAGVMAVAGVAFSAATLRADTIYWAPAGGGTWDTSTANWTGDDTVYSDGGVDTVNFTNTAGGTITLNANHYPAAVNVSATAGTYQFTGASITGAIAITKSGAGTLELRSDVLSTGGLFIDGGVVDVSQLKQTGGSIFGGTVNPIHFTGNSTLRISGTGGNYTYSPMIVDNGVTATLDQTASAASQYAGQISGGGNIIVTGGGNPIFFFNGNTFTGNLTIQGSFKGIGDASLGNVNNTTILDGGLFYMSHSVPVSYAATRTLQINNSSSQLLPGAGGVWNGNVTGTGFTLQGAQGYGAASLYLANANNSFVGQVYVLTGTLEVNTQGSLNGNNLLIGNSGGNGLRISGTPDGDFTGNISFAQGGGTYHFIDVVNAGATMNLTGALNTDTTPNQTLRKYGLGKLTLNNAAGTYAGRLEVRQGQLNVNYNTPNLVGVVVSNGASFGGSGTVNITGGAAITGDGSIDPGNSPGILTTAAVDPINGLGTLDFNFEFTKLDSPDYTNASASSNDVLRLTGASPFSGDTMTSANVISIYLPGNLVSGTNNFRGGFYTDTGDFLNSFSGATYQYYAQKSGGPFTYNGQQYDWMTNVYLGGVMLVTTVNETGTQFGGADGYVMEFIGLGIPEPSTALLIGFGGLALLRRRRNRKVQSTRTASGSKGKASALLAAIALAGMITAAQATVLTYTIHNNPGDAPNAGGSLNSYPGFGDNVDGLVQTNGSFIYHYGEGYGFTPDIALSFTNNPAIPDSTQGQRYYQEVNWPEVNFLVGAAAPQASNQFYTTFTSLAPGKGVRIESFDLFGYLTSTNHTVDWTIYKDVIGGAVLDSGSVVIAGNYQQNRAVVKTAALEYIGTSVLEIDHTSGAVNGFGMDNLSFTQVPEPTSLLLIGISGLALAWRRRNQ